jgi:hypothetical protein
MSVLALTSPTGDIMWVVMLEIRIYSILNNYYIILLTTLGEQIALTWSDFPASPVGHVI